MNYYGAYTMNGRYIYGVITPGILQDALAAINTVGGAGRFPGLWSFWTGQTMKDVKA